MKNTQISLKKEFLELALLRRKCANVFRDYIKK